MMRLGVARWAALWAGQGLLKDWSRPGRNRGPCRRMVSKPSGAILPPPVTAPFGLLRVLSVVVTFIWAGMYGSKTFLRLLDEYKEATVSPLF